MKRILPASLAVALAACAYALSAHAAPSPSAPPGTHRPAVKPAATGSKANITLPGDLAYQFKPGPGSEVAARYCLSCHSSAYVSTQPVLDKDRWLAEVTKMRNVYGAAIPDAQAETIVAYLVQAYGPPLPTATP